MMVYPPFRRSVEISYFTCNDEVGGSNPSSRKTVAQLVRARKSLVSFVLGKISRLRWRRLWLLLFGRKSP